MFYKMIENKCKEWYNSEQCTVRNLIEYIEKQNPIFLEATGSTTRKKREIEIVSKSVRFPGRFLVQRILRKKAMKAKGNPSKVNRKCIENDFFL